LDLRVVIDSIKERADLRQIMPDVVKHGTDYFCACPFHSERDPSCHVTKSYYHCFGCGASGDILSWFMSKAGGGFSFLEAMSIAAAEVGIVLEGDVRREISKLVDEREKREEELATYRDALEGSDKAKQYLAEERGLKPETIEQFRLGYRPDWNAIAIPIYSKSGGLESISFRFMDPANKQRWYHKNTETWTKRDALYNARAIEFETGPIYVCEGMFDVHSIWQAGCHRVVGIMGGQLNDSHVREFGDAPVVFVPDRKAEGDFNLFKQSVFRLRKAHPNLVIRVSLLPEGDANSVSEEELKQALNNAENAELAILKHDLNECTERDQEYRVARLVATGIDDPLTKDDIVHWLSDRWQKSVEVVRQALTRSDAPVAKVKTMQEVVADLEESERSASVDGLGLQGTGLDHYIERPRTGHVVMIAARPAVGKTLLALNIMHNCHEAQVPTLFVSQEQPPKELAYRLSLMLSGEAGQPVDNRTLRHNIIHDTDWWKLHRTKLIDTFPHVRFEGRRLSPQAIKDSIIDASYSIGEAVKVVFIDYLGLLRDDGNSRSSYEKASNIARDIQAVTQELDVFGIYLSQVSRDGKDGTERITYDMGRDSGVIEEIADYFVGLWKSKDDLTHLGVEKIMGSVSKNRHGKCGDFTLMKDMTTLKLTPVDFHHEETITMLRSTNPWGEDIAVD